MSIFSELWGRLVGSSGLTVRPEFLIHYFHPWHLLCTPQGVYVRSAEEFERLRERVLSAAEISEYGVLSVGTTIIGPSKKAAELQDKRFNALQQQVCLGLLAEVDARKRSEILQYGTPVTLDRWPAYGADTQLGIEMIVCAVQHGWHNLANISREISLVSAFIITGRDGQRLVLPLHNVDRVTIYPSRGSISYANELTAHLNLLEPSWETWG